MNSRNIIFAVALLTLSSGSIAEAQSFTTLSQLGPEQLATPSGGPAALTVSGNTLYGSDGGTGNDGGTATQGTIFALNAQGTGYHALYTFSGISYPNFTNSDGEAPNGGLILSGSRLYGTASEGGAGAGGTIFTLLAGGGGFVTLHSFTNDLTNSDGSQSASGLVLSGHRLYGTARYGGTADLGTVFALDTSGGNFTNLYSFTNGSDGAGPQARLVLAGATLYGTTYRTIYSLNTNANESGLTVLHNFPLDSGQFGSLPQLILSGDTLYGTDPYGGVSGTGSVFSLNTNGSNFTILYNFSPATQNDNAEYTASSPNIDGVNPTLSAISGNVLYGTASAGGSGGYGTVFALNTDGTGFTTLYSFTNGSDGVDPGVLSLSSNALFGVDLSFYYATPPKQVFELDALYCRYTATPSSAVVPFTVQFTSPEIDSAGNAIIQWNWNFGDNSTSTEQNPSHTYTITGSYSPTLTATNSNGAVVFGYGPPVAVESPADLVVNGGFETGDFTGWTLSGQQTWEFSVESGSYPEIAPHSGSYLATLGQYSFGSDLSQTLATTAGGTYSLSLWLNAPTSDANEFLVSWNGNVLFEETNIASSGWTNLQMTITALGTNSVLEFGFGVSYGFLGIDDVSVVPPEPPGITGTTLAGTNLVLTGSNGILGATCYVLTSTNVGQPLSTWATVATNLLSASGDFNVTVTNAVNPKIPQQFYVLRLR